MAPAVSCLLCSRTRFLRHAFCGGQSIAVRRTRPFVPPSVRPDPVGSERNMVRACWEVETAQYVDPDCFVFIDESHVDQKTAQRQYSWALVGLPPVERSTFLKGVRHSILPALSTDGVIALDIFEGSVNKERFMMFLRDQVVRGFCIHLFISLMPSARPHS